MSNGNASPSSHLNSTEESRVEKRKRELTPIDQHPDDVTVEKKPRPFLGSFGKFEAFGQTSQSPFALLKPTEAAFTLEAPPPDPTPNPWIEASDDKSSTQGFSVADVR